MKRLHDAATSFIASITQVQTCIEAIMSQPGLEQWLTNENYDLLLSWQAACNSQRARAENIQATAKWNQVSQSPENKAQQIQEAAELEELARVNKKRYSNLLGTLNYVRKQNGLTDIRQVDRELN